MTGIGLVTPLGNDTRTTWQGACAGRSGVNTITAFDAGDLPVRFAAEVRNFDPLTCMDCRDVGHSDPVTRYAMAASRQALDDAQFTLDEENADDVGVIVGTGTGGLHACHEQFRLLFECGPGAISPYFGTMFMPDGTASYLSIALGARGPNFALVSACCTGANAVGEAAEMIRRGDAIAMLAGGADSGVTPLTMAAFANMQALSRRNDDPPRASRPFDAERDGFVVGEGAGMLLLEDADAARQRGARIYAELVSYAATSDAYHIVEPAPGGAGLARAMQRALAKGRLAPTDVGYINAHGTSTPFNDSGETEAIKSVFGAHAYALAVSSTKSQIGHTLGAAGAIEAAITVLALHDGVAPPTINLTTPDPACDLDYVPNEARQAAINVALSNSMGFGGHNAVLAFRRE